jgi:DNA-binding LacI/PurR family transcriptional regulator
MRARRIACNDQILCNTTVPPASSIEHDGEKIGYDAAALLDQMMQSGQLIGELIRQSRS